MESKEEMYAGVVRNELLHRIKTVATSAETLQRVIEMDMIKFFEGKGKDMGMILARIITAEGDLLQ